MSFQFEGFSAPNGTFVPDEVFDVLAPELSEAELRVLLYIIRRTFGFKKSTDDISLKQMIYGIRKKDGTVLDKGTGMAKSANWRGIKGLLEKGIIFSKRNSSLEKGDMPTTYSIRFKQAKANIGPPSDPSNTSGQNINIEPVIGGNAQDEIDTDSVVSKRTPPSSLKEPARGLQENPQYTVLQQTDLNLSNIRKQQAEKFETPPSTPPAKPSIFAASPQSSSLESIGTVLFRTRQQPSDSTPEEALAAIRAYLKEVAPKFNDQAPLDSSVTRAYRLYDRANLALGAFLGLLLEVASNVRERQSKVTKKANGSKVAMPYFFACLEDRLGLRKKNRGDVALYH